MAKQNLVRERTVAIGEEIRTGNVDSILSSLYQRILADLGVNITRFNYLMEKFLSDKRNAIPQNIKERSSARGNLRKELLKAVMTWKVFCKGLRFLNISRFSISIELHHLNGKTTIHRRDVVLDNSAFDPTPEGELIEEDDE